LVKIGDGTAFNTSLLPDAEEMPGYRVWVQPYKPTRVETFLGGTFAVSHNALLSHGFVTEGEALVWSKAARAAGQPFSYVLR
jgi:hypothetical protein